MWVLQHLVEGVFCHALAALLVLLFVGAALCVSLRLSLCDIVCVAVNIENHPFAEVAHAHRDDFRLGRQRSFVNPEAYIKYRRVQCLTGDVYEDLVVEVFGRSGAVSVTFQESQIISLIVNGAIMRDFAQIGEWNTQLYRLLEAVREAQLSGRRYALDSWPPPRQVARK